MSRYPLVPLGTVLNQARDEIPVELDRSYRMGGIYSFGRGLFARPPIAGTDTKYTTLFRLHEGQFVMSRLKAWEGAVAVVSPEFQGLAVSQEYPTFDIDRERADPAYVGWLCRWERFWESLLGQSKGLGARRDRVHPDRLFSVRVPLPSLHEQRRLIRRIDSIVDRARSMEGPKLAVAEAEERLTGAVLGRCEASAPTASLGSLLEPVFDEVSVELDQTYRTAGIYSFGRGLFARSPMAGTDTKYKTLFRLHEGQFIYSRLFAWEGALAVVPSEFNGFCVSQEFPTFNIDQERADPGYLGWLCRWDRFWEALQVGTKGLGLRRQRVHPDRLLAVRIPLPSPDEQRRLGAVAHTVHMLGQRAEEFSALERALVPSVVNAALRGDL